jgi:hypothetical protein
MLCLTLHVLGQSQQTAAGVAASRSGYQNGSGFGVTPIPKTFKHIQSGQGDPPEGLVVRLWPGSMFGSP